MAGTVGCFVSSAAVALGLGEVFPAVLTSVAGGELLATGELAPENDSQHGDNCCFAHSSLILESEELSELILCLFQGLDQICYHKARLDTLL